MHEAIGAREHRTHTLQKARVAEAADEFEHACGADAAGAELSGEVAFALLRGAHVGEDHGEELRIHFARMHEFDGRNADAFLRDFAAGAHGAGYIPPTSA